MKLFCRAALTLLASLLLCTASHAEPEVIQGSLGDVIRVPITADCPAQSVVRQYTLILDGNNTGIPAQGCGGDPHAVSFLLDGTSGAVPPENAAAWHRMTGFPWQGNGSALARDHQSQSGAVQAIRVHDPRHPDRPRLDPRFAGLYRQRGNPLLQRQAPGRVRRRSRTAELHPLGSGRLPAQDRTQFHASAGGHPLPR